VGSTFSRTPIWMRQNLWQITWVSAATIGGLLVLGYLIGWLIYTAQLVYAASLPIEAWWPTALTYDPFDDEGKHFVVGLVNASLVFGVIIVTVYLIRLARGPVPPKQRRYQPTHPRSTHHTQPTFLPNSRREGREARKVK
jgi:hypothetical protein